MAKHKTRKRNARSRDAPEQQRGAVMLCSRDAWTALCGDGYRPLTQCPEVMMCVNAYADLISSMTIHLMRNTEDGDVRVKNELSRKLDINPCSYMTRSTFISTIVEALLTTGNQVTIPVYEGGYLRELIPVPPSMVSMRGTRNGYTISINGRDVDPETVLHFAWRPDPEQPWQGRGVNVSLRDIVKGLRQADSTRQALLRSPAPSIIVKVGGLMQDFQSAEGRQKLRDQYIDASDNGQPWIIPADAFEVDKVQPLTLADLAINESMELDKRAAAAIFGVTPYTVGIGAYSKEEHNNFVSTRVRAIAEIIQQEMTKKLLISPDMYWRFNSRSLMAYSLSETITAGQSMVEHMAMDRNEWRDWIGLPPDPRMRELLALENYIPAEKLGEQKKLNGGEDSGKTDGDAAG